MSGNSLEGNFVKATKFLFPRLLDDLLSESGGYGPILRWFATFNGMNSKIRHTSEFLVILALRGPP